MRNGRGRGRSVASSALLALVAVASSGCQTIILGAPKWPPCYLDSEQRALDADGVQKFYPDTYDWIREMDALCISWSRP